jgi:hypothetical protein
MLDDRLVVTAIDVQSDNSIQRNTYAYEFEHFVQESSVAVSKHTSKMCLVPANNPGKEIGEKQQTHP